MARVDMINSLTGMVMSVPAELVDFYKKAGCMLAEQSEKAEDFEDNNQEGTESTEKGKAKN